MKTPKFSFFLKLFLGAALIAAASNLTLADAPAGCISSHAANHGTTTPRIKGSTASPYGFLEYLPAGYSPTGPTFPLLIHLHGLGDVGPGTDPVELERLMSLNGPSRRIREGREFPALVFSPQSIGWYDMQNLRNFIDFAIANYRVDKTRIYLTGLSMGGGGVWNYMSSDPDRLAAAVSNCGAPYPYIVPSDGEALKKVPHLAIHAKNDGTVGVGTTYAIGNFIGAALGAINQVEDGDIFEHDITVHLDLETRRWVTEEGNRKYRDANGNFLNSPYIYAFPAFEGHGTWENTYADEDTWDWLFCQSKPENETANEIKIEAENYTQMNNVRIEPTTDFGLGSNVGWIENGSWMDYEVNVPISGVYRLNLRTANWNLGKVKVTTAQGQDLTQPISLISTGGAQNWATTQTTITLHAGVQTLRFYSVENGWNFNWFELIPPRVASARVEAENYSRMYNVGVEPTTDVGLGNNVGWIENGSWMDYEVNVPTSGVYTLNLRTANWGYGKVKVTTPQKRKLSQIITLASTGGTQNWATTQTTIKLHAGVQTLRFYSVEKGWNFNWFELINNTSGILQSPPQEMLR